MNNESLSEEQKQAIRDSLHLEGRKLLGVKYEYGAEWLDLSKKPESLDCSELVAGIFNLTGLHCPDGSQAQYEYFYHSPAPRTGDLAFFGRNGNPSKIYHVGMVFDGHDILEARAFDPSASFKTGAVILRDISRWIAYKNWVGFMAHPKLL